MTQIIDLDAESTNNDTSNLPNNSMDDTTNVSIQPLQRENMSTPIATFRPISQKPNEIRKSGRLLKRKRETSILPPPKRRVTNIDELEQEDVIEHQPTQDHVKSELNQSGLPSVPQLTSFVSDLPVAVESINDTENVTVAQDLEHVSCFECLPCSKKFVNKYNLQRHNSTIHSETPHRYQCSVCLASYKSKSGFDKHKKRHQDAIVSCVIIQEEQKGKLI